MGASNNLKVSENVPWETPIRAHGSLQWRRPHRHQPMPSALALVTLANSQAPYKGQWLLVENHPGTVEAIHSTYHPEQPIGCVIEQRCFTARQAALDFTHHLLSHGWGIHTLHEAGEHFWFRLAG